MRLLPLALLLIAAAGSGLPAQSPEEIRRLKRGSWRPQDVPAGWMVKRVGRYEMQSNCEPAKVEAIARHLNAMYEVYSTRFPSRRTPGKPFPVKVFRDRAQYLAYGAPPSSAAYYSKTDKEMVGYDTGKTDGVIDGGTTGPRGSVLDRMRARLTLDTFAVFAHEGWHQYFHWWCPSHVPFPSWCDEGIGEYFGTARVRDGRMVVGAVNDYRLGTIKAAIRRGNHIPLQELVTFDQQKYYAVANLAYAQGWSLVHFFLEHPEYRKKRYLTRYVAEFVDTHEIAKAVQIAFRGLDWEACERDWKEWVLALKYEDPDPDEVRQAEAEALAEAGKVPEEAPAPAPPAGGDPPPAPPVEDPPLPPGAAEHPARSLGC